MPKKKAYLPPAFLQHLVFLHDNVQIAQAYSSPNRNNLHQTLQWERRGKELCEEGGTMVVGVASPLGWLHPLCWLGTCRHVGLQSNLIKCC